MALSAVISPFPGIQDSLLIFHSHSSSSIIPWGKLGPQMQGGRGGSSSSSPEPGSAGQKGREAELLCPGLHSPFSSFFASQPGAGLSVQVTLQMALGKPPNVLL